MLHYTLMHFKYTALMAHIFDWLMFVYIYIYTTHISVLRVKVQVDWIATLTIFSTVGCRGGLNNVCSSIDGEWFFSTEVSAWDMSACWLLALPGHLLCASLLPDVCKRGCRRWCQHHISPLKKNNHLSSLSTVYLYLKVENSQTGQTQPGSRVICFESCPQWPSQKYKRPHTETQEHMCTTQALKEVEKRKGEDTWDLMGRGV